MTKTLKRAGIAALFAAAFVAGALSYKHRDVFVGLLHLEKPGAATDANNSVFRRDAELLSGAFKAKIIERQLLPACTTPAELHAAIERMNFPVASFFDAYDRIKIGRQELAGDIFRIDYQVGEGSYSAYAYLLKAGEVSQSDRTAVLVIPGTGLNQSTEIIRRNRDNYQANIIDAFDGQADIYVYVKPNEDFLAIHNGRDKIREEFFVRYLLNKGGSYSAKYLVDTLSFSKYLKGRYKKVVIAGLSQGGEAALLNALQSAPDLAIVASGFSVLTESLDWAGFQQIIIPGLRQYFTNDRIREIIGKSATHYLFTYGAGEAGAYRVEADEQITCRYLTGLPNVSCAVHGGGHVYDLVSVGNFLAQHQ
jgi:hypothetical protein